MTTAWMQWKAPRRGLAAWVAAVVLAAGASVALTAWAQPMRHHGEGAAMGMPMLGGHGLERMLDEVNATEAQRTQIRQIAAAAQADMKAQREANRPLRQRAMEVFTAPNVDANAAEAVRQQMLQAHDQSSKRMLQAMLDVSRVLTPEQRTTLAARMKERGDRMREQMERRPGGPRS